MKVYEKLGMSTEAALKWVGECVMRGCRDCPARKTQMLGDTWTECASKYLLSEVPEPPKIPRWRMAKTQEDFDKLYQHFELDYCSKFSTEFSTKFKYKACKWSNGCFYKYLSELVEVPESEVDND